MNVDAADAIVLGEALASHVDFSSPATLRCCALPQSARSRSFRLADFGRFCALVACSTFGRVEAPGEEPTWNAPPVHTT